MRVWQDLDLAEVKKHLLICGDPSGDCANCREVGINIQNAKSCPTGKTEFKYMATRVTGSTSQAKRLKAKRPDLIAIDFSDFKDAKTRSEAHKFLR
ncbi:MAG: hypothetical protein HQ579_09195 [Candidatus Omnitrophica bacterium]|nr:hypothetical protein [Candidatus Omnitrophota bacterium]